MFWRIKGWRLAKHAKGFVCVTYEEADDGRIRRRRLTLAAPNKILANVEASDLVAQLERSQPKERLSVGQIIAQYLDQTKAITKQDMTYHAKPIIEAFGSFLPSAITEDLCETYAMQRDRSAGTIRVELGLMNTALKWAAKKDKIAKAPYVWMPAAPPPRDRRLTKDEAAALLAAAEKPHVKLFIEIALQTAARAAAILELKWLDNINLDTKQIKLGGVGRQKKRPTLPINETLLATLTKAKEASLSPWVIEWAGKPIKDINRAFNLAVANAGLDRKVTPHVLRHTAASWMAEERVPMSEIAAYLGHSDPALTFKIYAKYSPDYLQKAAKALG